MSGVKGKSGRKPNQDSNLERSKKYTFYVKEYARTNANGNIVEWIEDSYFQWFKMHHGARWQERVRAWMRQDVQHWRQTSFWRCKCPHVGIMGNYRSKRQPHCRLCDEYYRDVDRINNMSYTEKQEYYKRKIEELKKDKE